MNGTFDLVGSIMAFENDELDFEEVVDLFQYLLDTGMIFTLQGHYQRIAKSLLDEGLISHSS